MVEKYFCLKRLLLSFMVRKSVYIPDTVACCQLAQKELPDMLPHFHIKKETKLLDFEPHKSKNYVKKKSWEMISFILFLCPLESQLWIEKKDNSQGGDPPFQKY